MKALLLLFVAACGARSELDVPEIHDASAHDVRMHDAKPTPDVEEAGIDVPLSTFCEVPDASRPKATCTVAVTVGEIISWAGCINDYAIHPGDIGQIEYACDGTSTWAAATFGTMTLEGSINKAGTFVDVCFGTLYPWQDGADCAYTKSTWSTSQRIYGDISSGALTYTYGERVIEGHSCWMPCTASAALTVQ